MRFFKTITALLLCATMLFSFTACMNEESKALVGTWEAEFDIANYLNAAIDDEMEEYGQFFNVDELVMTLTIEYLENGKYKMTVDADKFAEECAALAPEFAESFKETHKYISDTMGIPVSVLLDEAGKSYEEMAEDFVGTLDPEAMAEALSMSGKFKADGGKLYRSNSVDEKISKDSYETYELSEDGTLIVTSYVGDDADSNPFVYPMTFEKIK